MYEQICILKLFDETVCIHIRNKPLSETIMINLSMHIGISRPQWFDIETAPSVLSER